MTPSPNPSPVWHPCTIKPRFLLWSCPSTISGCHLTVPALDRLWHWWSVRLMNTALACGTGGPFFSAVPPIATEVAAW